MTIKISKLEFGAVLQADGENCLIEIIYPLDGQGNEVDSDFIDVEELKAAIKFLETEANR